VTVRATVTVERLVLTAEAEITTPAEVNARAIAQIEERRRAEARYKAAVERRPGAPHLHTFRANANGNRAVSLDGDQIGYVANSGLTRPSWRGILGRELETLTTGAPRMEDAREWICVEHLRRLEREVAGEIALAVALLRDLYPQAVKLRLALAELRDRMLRDDPAPGWPAAPHAVREAAARLLSVLEVTP
jgi:hypothetical protein